MELSAPFLASYWQYIASVFAGIFIAQVMRRVFKQKKQGYTVDVDPMQDGETADIPQSDPRELGDNDQIPYPWFDDRLTEEQMKQKSAEFYEKMNKRRTVRKISDEEVPLEVLENIIKTAG